VGTRKEGFFIASDGTPYVCKYATLQIYPSFRLLRVQLQRHTLNVRFYLRSQEPRGESSPRNSPSFVPDPRIYYFSLALSLSGGEVLHLTAHAFISTPQFSLTIQTPIIVQSINDPLSHNLASFTPHIVLKARAENNDIRTQCAAIRKVQPSWRKACNGRIAFAQVILICRAAIFALAATSMECPPTRSHIAFHKFPERLTLDPARSKASKWSESMAAGELFPNKSLGV
jgi:hypothetical protein